MNIKNIQEQINLGSRGEPVRKRRKRIDVIKKKCEKKKREKSKIKSIPISIPKSIGTQRNTGFDDPRKTAKEDVSDVYKDKADDQSSGAFAALEKFKFAEKKDHVLDLRELKKEKLEKKFDDEIIELTDVVTGEVEEEEKGNIPITQDDVKTLIEMNEEDCDNYDKNFDKTENNKDVIKLSDRVEDDNFELDLKDVDHYMKELELEEKTMKLKEIEKIKNQVNEIIEQKELNEIEKRKAIENIKAEFDKAIKEKFDTKDVFDGLKEFGLSQKDVEKNIDGFSELSVGKKFLVLDNLRQVTLGRIKEDALKKQKRKIRKLSFKEGKGKWIKDLSHNVLQGIMKKHGIAKEEKILANDVSKGGVKMHGKVLQELVKGMEGLDIDVIKNAKGKFEINYFSERSFGDLSEKEKDDLKKANRIFNDLSKIPEEWLRDDASMYKKQKYKKAKKEYKEAKKTVLDLKRKHGCSEEEADLYLNDREMKIKLNQFLNTNPEVEKELASIKNSKIWKRSLNGIITEKGIFLGMGVFSRSVTTAALGTMGLPLAAAGMGGLTAGQRARGDIREAKRLAVSGMEDGNYEYATITKDEFDKDKEYKKSLVKGASKAFSKERLKEYQKEKSRQKHEGKFSDVEDYVDAEYLYESIEDLTLMFNEMDGVPQDEKGEEKKKELLKSLKFHVDDAKAKLDGGTINFGEDKSKQILHKYNLIHQISQGFGVLVREDIADPEKEYFAEYVKDNEAIQKLLKKRKIESKDKKKAYITKKVFKGMGIAAGFSMAGHLIRDYVHDVIESSNVADSPVKVTYEDKDVLHSIKDQPVTEKNIEETPLKATQELSDSPSQVTADTDMITEEEMKAEMIPEKPEEPIISKPVIIGGKIDTASEAVYEALKSDRAPDSVKLGFIRHWLKNDTAELSPENIKLAVRKVSVSGIKISDEQDINQVFKGDEIKIDKDGNVIVGEGSEIKSTESIKNKVGEVKPEAEAEVRAVEDKEEIQTEKPFQEPEFKKLNLVQKEKNEELLKDRLYEEMFSEKKVNRSDFETRIYSDLEKYFKALDIDVENGIDKNEWEKISCLARYSEGSRAEVLKKYNVFKGAKINPQDGFDYYEQLKSFKGNVKRVEGIVSLLKKADGLEAKNALERIVGENLKQKNVIVDSKSAYVVKDLKKGFDFIIKNDGGDLEFAIKGSRGGWSFNGGKKVSWYFGKFEPKTKLNKDNLLKALKSLKQL